MRRLSSRTDFSLCASAAGDRSGARQAAPGLLVIYHQGGGVGTDGLFDDMRARYSGHVAIARDLAVF